MKTLKELGKTISNHIIEKIFILKTQRRASKEVKNFKRRHKGMILKDLHIIHSPDGADLLLIWIDINGNIKDYTTTLFHRQVIYLKDK